MPLNLTLTVLHRRPSMAPLRGRWQPSCGSCSPNGYLSKVAFADDRVDLDEFEDDSLKEDALERGGSVEVFPDESGARARADYIQTVLKGGGLGSEYDYVKGPVLVRVTGDLVPSKAKDYQKALG